MSVTKKLAMAGGLVLAFAAGAQIREGLRHEEKPEHNCRLSNGMVVRNCLLEQPMGATGKIITADVDKKEKVIIYDPGNEQPYIILNRAKITDLTHKTNGIVSSKEEL